ncbi:MAG TPA: hypothetical protein VL128_11790 [Candidatus Eisenbacteria bacterium]|nr:hypothetical protein [Candidatus Eisenbacteria bacterium]
MKLAKLSVFALAVGLLAGTSAFARSSNKTALNLFEKINVNGTTLDPGHYTVNWEGTGPNVKVNIEKGKDTVATTTAKLTEQPKPNDNNAYGSAVAPDGSHVLTTIYVGGKRTTLNLPSSPSMASSGSSASK